MKKVVERTISKRTWSGDDDYLVVPEIQVMEHDGWKKGQKVKVTIETIDTP